MAETEITTKRAVAADIDAIAAIVEAGFQSYGDFLPADWAPPSMSVERERILETLTAPGTWARLACAGSRVVGHVGFVPGHERRAGDAPKPTPKVPGLAHLWHLFVDPGWWGAGVAALLHELALAEMREQGYAQARLFTPALHTRARRFYERRGWATVDRQFNDGLGLEMVEYRLELRPERSPASPRDRSRPGSGAVARARRSA